MDRDTKFLSKHRIIELFNRKSKERVEKEVITCMQNFGEKFISDIVNRTVLFTKHRGGDTITSEDIFFTVEKEFDYSFGNRIIKSQKKVPTDDFVEKVAEISKRK